MKKSLSLLLLTFLGLAASAQRIEVSTGLPGALGSLSTWNGGGRLTNLAYPQVYWFTNQGTTNWAIPSGAKSLRIQAVAPGGAGASGARGPAGTIRSGGGAGGGGSYGEVNVRVSDLWTNTLSIVVPASPIGGGSVTTDDTYGTNGSAAATCAIYCGPAANTNILMVVFGGNPGVGGDNNGSAGGNAGSYGLFQGSAGAASSATGGVGANASVVSFGLAGIGGGAGGGISSADVPSGGGFGGGTLFTFPNITSPGGGSPGVSGTNIIVGAYSNIFGIHLHGWYGGGGGGSSTNSAGGNGADGYGWGSGGGGGGASLNGFASGKGGNGGPGAVSITVYCAFPSIAAPEWIGAAAQWTMDAVSFIRHVGIPLLEMSKEQVNQ